MEKSNKCKYHNVCRLNAHKDSKEGFCILHCEDPKDQLEFTQALERHRKERGDAFKYIIFPVKANFRRFTFSKLVDFRHATFSQEADFSNAKFLEGADFEEAKFENSANFEYAEFSERAKTAGANFQGTKFLRAANFGSVKFFKNVNFSKVTFFEEADFSFSEFSKDAYFVEAQFLNKANFKKADFYSAIFSGEAIFNTAAFSGKARFEGTLFLAYAMFDKNIFSEGADFSHAFFSVRASFRKCSFLGRTTFLGRPAVPPKLLHICKGMEPNIFHKVELDFREVNINPLDALIFRDADFNRCLFQGTDLRKAELTNEIWPEPQSYKRIVLHDEAVSVKKGKFTEWSHLEKLYRDLKKNYEDRGNHERAGDFHYGEKEMRRKNPDTSPLLRAFLTIYWLVSGYGERYLRPLFWAGALWVVCTIGYLKFGIAPEGNAGKALAMGNACDWMRAGIYSLQVMALQRPEGLNVVGVAATGLRAIQGILGPVIIGLFALALRQRLKR